MGEVLIDKVVKFKRFFLEIFHMKSSLDKGMKYLRLFFILHRKFVARGSGNYRVCGVKLSLAVYNLIVDVKLNLKLLMIFVT